MLDLLLKKYRLGVCVRGQMTNNANVICEDSLTGTRPNIKAKEKVVQKSLVAMSKRSSALCVCSN